VDITEVRVSLRDGGNKKLKAYVTVTFDDCFVVRNIKVIEGTHGLFVAMPARKMKQFCSKCGKRIDVGGKYCPICAAALPALAPFRPEEERRGQQGHQDIAHPINQQFRDYLQKKILDTYDQEKAKAPTAENALSHDDEVEDETAAAHAQ
jgi:stage V sporulation protein G